MPTTQYVPFAIRDHFARILKFSLLELHKPYLRDESGCAVHFTRAWKLFFLLPRMLLMPTLRGGDGGRRELNRRVRLFDAGEWTCLIAETRSRRLTEYRKPLFDESRSINRAEKFVAKGELSHVARELTRNEVVPYRRAQRYIYQWL